MNLNALWEFVGSLFCAILGTCAADHCRVENWRGVDHTICSFDVADVTVRTHWKDENGKIYGRPSRLSDGDGKLLMAMNGGMYHDDLGPVGLYVEQGKQEKTLSTKGGYGNFHLLPNGVFWMRNGKVGVRETRAYQKGRIVPDFATQSGPMLVIDGKRHPRFLKNSDSRKIRNGVGVSKDGKRIHFAISHGTVTFWDFGDLFKDRLQAHNALFLDGTVSTIRADGLSRSGWRAVGPLIGVYSR
ncbi:MAG: phosphodiester glycosidase family protein [Pseudomonadota bacterium]